MKRHLALTAAVVLLAGAQAIAADGLAGKLDQAQVLFTARRFSQAETAAQQVTPATSDSAILSGAADVIILCKLSQGDFDGAKQAAQQLKTQIATSSPGNAALAYLDSRIAEIEAKRAAYEQTIAALEQTAAAHRNDEIGANAAYRIAITKATWGKTQEALEAFQRVVDDFGFSERALPAQLSMGGACEDSGRYDEAEAWYERLVQRSPNTPYAAQAVARIKVVRLAQGDTTGATQDMNEFIAAHPDTQASAMAQYCLGEILLAEGSTDQAKSVFEAVVREHRSTLGGEAAITRVVQLWMEEAGSLSWAKRYSQAISKYRQVVELAPDGAHAPEALIEMGHNYGWSGDHKTPLGLYQQVLRDYPDSPEVIPAHFYVAREYQSGGRCEEAIQHALIVAEKDTDDFRLASSYHRLMGCYFKLQQYDKARFWAQKIIDHEDSLQFTQRKCDAERAFATSFKFEGRYDEAERLLQAAAERHRGTPCGTRVQNELARVRAEAAKPE